MISESWRIISDGSFGQRRSKRPLIQTVARTLFADVRDRTEHCRVVCDGCGCGEGIDAHDRSRAATFQRYAVGYQCHSLFPSKSHPNQQLVHSTTPCSSVACQWMCFQWHVCCRAARVDGEEVIVFNRNEALALYAAMMHHDTASADVLRSFVAGLWDLALP